jgi:hypothetical protein
MTRAKVLDQAWQDRKAELALEQAQGHKTILSLAAKSLADANNTGFSAAAASAANASPTLGSDSESKSAARKQVEEREVARKGNHDVVFLFF